MERLSQAELIGKPVVGRTLRVVGKIGIESITLLLAIHVLVVCAFYRRAWGINFDTCAESFPKEVLRFLWKLYAQSWADQGWMTQATLCQKGLSPNSFSQTSPGPKYMAKVA